jgi:hypothetical protein
VEEEGSGRRRLSEGAGPWPSPPLGRLRPASPTPSAAAVSDPILTSVVAHSPAEASREASEKMGSDCGIRSSRAAGLKEQEKVASKLFLYNREKVPVFT